MRKKANLKNKVFLMGAILFIFSLTVALDILEALPEPVSYYNFEDNTRDVSGVNSNHGYNHGANFSDGKVNRTLTFDGVNDYVNLGTDLSLNPDTEMSIAVWVNATAPLKAKAPIVERFNSSQDANKSYYLRIESSSGNVSFCVYNRSYAYTCVQTLPGTISGNRWTHIVGTYNATCTTDGIKLYINGSPKVSGSAIGDIRQTPNENTTIGGFISTDSCYFNGSIDEVKFYNRTLNSTEVLSLYCATESVQPAAFNPCAHCVDLSGEAREFCINFSQNDSRINNGNGYKNYYNLNGSLAHGETYIMRGYIDMYNATNDTYYLDKLVDHIDNVLLMTDNRTGIFDYRGYSEAGWSSNVTNTDTGKPIYDEHGVQYRCRYVLEDGVITSPMVEFAHLVLHSNPPLDAYYQNKARYYLNETKAVVKAHDLEWHNYGQYGYYKYYDNFPQINLRDQPFVPHNQQLALANTLFLLHHLITTPPDFEFGDKANRLIKTFKNDVDSTITSTGYIWHYWPILIPLADEIHNKVEDVAHGTIDVQSALLAYTCPPEGTIFTTRYMNRFADTFTRKIFINNARTVFPGVQDIAAVIDGTLNASYNYKLYLDNPSDDLIKEKYSKYGQYIIDTALYLDLAQFDRAVYAQVRPVYHTVYRGSLLIDNFAGCVKLLSYAKMAKWAKLTENLINKEDVSGCWTYSSSGSPSSSGGRVSNNTHFSSLAFKIHLICGALSLGNYNYWQGSAFEFTSENAPNTVTLGGWSKHSQAINFTSGGYYCLYFIVTFDNDTYEYVYPTQLRFDPSAASNNTWQHRFITKSWGTTKKITSITPKCLLQNVKKELGKVVDVFFDDIYVYRVN